MSILYIYIMIVFVVNLMWWVVCANISFEVGLCFCNPKWIYKHTKANWFGTAYLTIVVNVVFGPSALCYWFYKLCTVGRR